MPARRYIVSPQGGGAIVVVPPSYNFATDPTCLRRQARLFATRDISVMGMSGLRSNQLSALPAPPVSAFYVSPSGSDSNAGTLASPFKTLTKAQTAMRASSTKTTYVRAGTFNLTTGLALTTADNGTTWSYYPTDGVNSAVLDGGNSVSSGLIQLRGTSNVAINGLKVQHVVDYGILGWGGPNDPWGASTPLGTGNSILNCDVGFNTATSWQSGAIALSMPNSTIANNYAHDVGSMGISCYSYYAGNSVNGTVIKNNVVLNAVLRMSDGGCIYTNMNSGIQTDHVLVTNNYVANYGSAATNSVHAYYADDTASNVTFRGNVAGAPTVGVGTSGGYSAIAAFLIHGGNNNVIDANLVDLGLSGVNGTVIWYYGGNPTDPGMHGNTFTRNIVISKFTGPLNSTFSGRAVAFNQATNDPAGFAYAINSNSYWNYAAGGSVFTTGNNNNDASPTTQNPQISGANYSIAGGSPVFGAPVNFPALVGGWGPTSFVVSNSNRSSP